MSYLPTKRQRSNTSRESSNAIPQTTAPPLRQHPHQHQQHQQHQHPSHAHLNGSLALYPTASSSAAYSNGPYAAAAAQPAAAPSAHQVTYASYSAGPVTTQHNGYGAAGYQNNASPAAYGAAPYSPQHQANPYAAQYTHAAQPNPQLSPHAAHYASSTLAGVQNGAYTQTHAHNPQTAARMTYSPVSATHPTATSILESTSQRNSAAALATIQSHSQHSSLSYGDSYATHTPTHSGQYQTASPSYPDPTVASHYSPAPLPTPQSHDVSRHMSEDLPENDDEDAQGEPADESAEIYTNPDPSRPVSSIPTPSTDQSKPGEISCTCKKGRGKKKPCISCGCSKYGLSCNPACSCGGACGNPFTDLSPFFGPSGTYSKPCGANPCFATWLRNQPNVDELDVDLMVDMLLSDDESWAQIREYTEAFQLWEEQWKRARDGKGKKHKDERERLEFQLLRGALGNAAPDDFNGFRYSFCQSQWVPADLWDHCPECRMCRSSVEWHCPKHDRCTENRVCPNCASTTLPYHHQQQQQQQQQRQIMY
ncbi:hypothetical protein F4678DRAFT_101487 [Xylaria arbuscula]|nr:hypothetical protein F4678DRAFT_101487 [Xylaria arbuscula]